MRMHIELDDDLVAQVDRLAGARGRSEFVREALRTAVARELRVQSLRRAAGAIAAEEHDWDTDPASWVAEQRRSDARRVG